MVLRRFESLRRFSTSFKNVTPGRAFLNPRNAKKARNSGLFSYLHHFWQVNLAGAEGLSLACRLGCCSLVGSAQHRPRREPRPVRSRAPLALAHPWARGFGVDVGESTRERGRGGVARFLLQDENGRCWFGATGNFRGQNKRKRAENPWKSRKHIGLNRHRPYNKKCRGNPAGVCCRQAVSHSLYSTST